MRVGLPITHLRKNVIHRNLRVSTHAVRLPPLRISARKLPILQRGTLTNLSKKVTHSPEGYPYESQQESYPQKPSACWGFVVMYVPSILWEHQTHAFVATLNDMRANEKQNTRALWKCCPFWRWVERDPWRGPQTPCALVSTESHK